MFTPLPVKVVVLLPDINIELFVQEPLTVIPTLLPLLSKVPSVRVIDPTEKASASIRNNFV